MTFDEKLISAGHRCEVTTPGYYWARLIIWEESVKARAQRTMITHRPKEKYPRLCNASIVELWRLSDGRPMLRAGLERRERVQDWLFLARVMVPPGVEYIVAVDNAEVWSEEGMRQLERPVKP